jgi:hypothetical protein
MMRFWNNLHQESQSSTNKTERHDSTKTLLKVALITITHKFPLFYMLGKCKSYKCAAKCLIIFQFYFGSQCIDLGFTNISSA